MNHRISCRVENLRRKLCWVAAWVWAWCANGKEMTSIRIHSPTFTHTHLPTSIHPSKICPLDVFVCRLRNPAIKLAQYSLHAMSRGHELFRAMKRRDETHHHYYFYCFITPKLAFRLKGVSPSFVQEKLLAITYVNSKSRRTVESIIAQRKRFKEMLSHDCDQRTFVCSCNPVFVFCKYTFRPFILWLRVFFSA